MAILLSENDYGKSRVRLLRVSRQPDRHDIREMTIDMVFEGDFAAAHIQGDNSRILPTDTMKNTVYALARQYPLEAPEAFGLHLVEHFLTYNAQVSRVRIDIVETPWTRIAQGGKPHATAFTRAGSEAHTCEIEASRNAATVRAGIADLIVLKTTHSSFDGFLRDPYTTLKEDKNRILSTSIHASWLYNTEAAEFAAVWHGVRQTLLETFAAHDSRSLQHTLYAMGEAVLSSFDGIREIRMSLPNKHFHLVDLAPFGLDNPAEVFLPTDEPHGLIEATLRRE